MSIDLMDCVNSTRFPLMSFWFLTPEIQIEHAQLLILGERIRDRIGRFCLRPAYACESVWSILSQEQLLQSMHFTLHMLVQLF